MVLSRLAVQDAQPENMIPYLMQEHVAQVLSLLKMQLTYMGEETEAREMSAELPVITELLGRCIHTLRDLHTLELPDAFPENWLSHLYTAILNLQQGLKCQLNFMIRGKPPEVSHQRAVILYRVLLTAANHIILLCQEGVPLLELEFSDSSINACFTDVGKSRQAPAWMQLSMDFLKHQAAIIEAELNWSFSEKEHVNKIMLKLAL